MSFKWQDCIGCGGKKQKNQELFQCFGDIPKVQWLGLGTFTVGAQVQSLVGELRYHVLWSEESEKKKERERKRMIPTFLAQQVAEWCCHCLRWGRLWEQQAEGGEIGRSFYTQWVWICLLEIHREGLPWWSMVRTLGFQLQGLLVQSLVGELKAQILLQCGRKRKKSREKERKKKNPQGYSERNLEVGARSAPGWDG